MSVDIFIVNYLFYICGLKNSFLMPNFEALRVIIP